MKKEDEEKYLDKWGSLCFICGSHVEREDMALVHSIVPLEKYPEWGDPEIVHSYMACPECMRKGELV